MKWMLLIVEPRVVKDPETAAMLWNNFVSRLEPILPQGGNTKRLLEHVWQLPAKEGLSSLTKIAELAKLGGVRMLVHTSDEPVEFSTLP